MELNIETIADSLYRELERLGYDVFINPPCHTWLGIFRDTRIYEVINTTAHCSYWFTTDSGLRVHRDGHYDQLSDDADGDGWVKAKDWAFELSDPGSIDRLVGTLGPPRIA
jgi:hypothetical protein